MKVTYKIDSEAAEDLLSLTVRQDSADNQALLANLQDLVDQEQFTIKTEDGYRNFPVFQIDRIYTSAKLVYCQIGAQSYEIPERIYQMRNRLSHHRFIQISAAEIVNRAIIKRFDLSKTGAYQLILKDGSISPVSRRYMQSIRKEYLS